MFRLDGSILFAIFEVQNLDSIGRQDLCASHSIFWELLGGGSQSKRKLIQTKTTNQKCISSMGKGSTFPFILAHYWIWSRKRVTMYKMQIYLDTLSAVAEETEVEKERILSGCKAEEVVDARILLIRLLKEQGLYPIQISRFTGICLRSVNRFLLDFSCRMDTRKIVRLYYDNLRKKLGMS